MKTNLSFKLIILILVLFITNSCKKDDSAENADPWTEIMTKSIGASGGTLDAGSISISIPAGVFNGNYTLSIYSSDQKIFQNGQISPTFEIRGLPEEFDGVLPLSIKSDGAIQGDFYIAMGTYQFAQSLSDTVYALSYLPAVDSSGYIQSQIIVQKAKKMLSKKGGGPVFGQIADGSACVCVVTYRDTYNTSKGHFRVVYEAPTVAKDKAIMIGEALETSFLKFKEMNFDTTKLNGHYPIPVTVRPFQNPLLGKHFGGDNPMEEGCYFTPGLYLSPSFEFNSDKMQDRKSTLPKVGHECFHMFQSLYNCGGSLKNWLVEATATYVEEFFNPEPGPYLPSTFDSHFFRSFLGLQAGNTWKDPNPTEEVSQEVNSAFHGYGVSNVIKYFCNLYPNSGELLRMIQRIDQNIHPVEAVLGVESGENIFNFWNECMTNYVLKKTYSKVSQRGFVTGAMYVETPIAKNLTMDASQSGNQSQNYPLPDLSAGFATIDLTGDYSPNQKLKVSYTTTGDTADLRLYTYYYKYKVQYEIPILENPGVETTLKSLKENGYSILLMLVNSRHITPYTGITNVTLNIGIDGLGLSVSTGSVYNLHPSFAQVSGSVNSDGGFPVTAKGFCWGENPNPTTSDFSTNEGSGLGQMNSYMMNLIPGTPYYVRAYATNSQQTAYGNQLSFTTSGGNLPSVHTYEAVDMLVKKTSIEIGGKVEDAGGSAITARGFCWSTNSNPTIAHDSINLGPGSLGNFNGTITGLTKATKYYVRAFAINSSGLAYGNEVSFTTAVCEVGDNYLGGIVAYLWGVNDTGHVPFEQHGIIVAPVDQSTGAPWGCSSTLIGGTSLDAGTGQANTLSIINGCIEAGTAASICNELVLNGYNDWFLPSARDLFELEWSKDVVGGYSEGGYWSSSEVETGLAYIKVFGQNELGQVSKSSNYHVRAVRYF
jgi:hypothetical protein